MSFNSPIRNIVFDLGGVLVDWNPEYVYSDVFSTTEKMNWFLSQVCNDEWNVTQDAGRTYAEGEEILIKKYPEYEAQIKLFSSKWHLMFSGPIEENVTLFTQLKKNKNYKLYALTNWSAEKWPHALQLFPFFNDFDGAIVSGIEKTRKPYPEIYQILLKRYRLKPEETLFIDDKKENLLTAAKIGMKTIHCTKKNELARQMREFSIIF